MGLCIDPSRSEPARETAAVLATLFGMSAVASP
jgi:hypothetical protein